MAYNVSSAFREQCYSGSSLYKCRLIIGGNEVPISQLASITISSPIIDSRSEIFYIGSFISQELTIQFKNLDGIETSSGTNVELYISQYVNNEWIEVPIGKYLIDESPENYYKTSEIKCLDYAIKFATNLDYSPSFVDGKITIDNLLQWICNYYGVTLGDYPNTNGSLEIATYDSTISGKRWISYIAEIKGCNAKMDRLGRLTLKPLKSQAVATINALKSKSWELGEKYEIQKVTYFDAIRNYTFGGTSINVNYNNNPLYYNGNNRIRYLAPETDSNTLIIRQDNPFILNEEVVENIYDVVKWFKIWSLKCENYGDISLDAWDIIEYTLGDETYYTLNNNTITYAMTIMSKIETKVPTKQQEVTTNVVEGTQEQRIRRLKTEINTIDNTILLQAEEIAENTANIGALQISDEQISSQVSSLNGSVTQLQNNTYTKTEIQRIADGTGVDGVKVTSVESISGTFDLDGMHYEKLNAPTKSTINEKGVDVKKTTDNSVLLFAGFDDTLGQSIVEAENLRTRKYLNIGNNSRIEDYGTGGGVFIL